MRSAFVILGAAAILACPDPASAQWADNGDGTFTYSKTTSAVRWTLAASKLAIERKPHATVTCAQERVDAGQCPAIALDSEFPNRKSLACYKNGGGAWQPSDRCSGNGTWIVDLVRCDTAAPYVTWSGLNVEGATSNAVYEDACKTKYKNNNWWVPSWGDTKKIRGRKANPGLDIVGKNGGEARVIAQGDGGGTEQEQE